MLRLCSSSSTNKNGTLEMPAELQKRLEANYSSSYHQPLNGRVYDRKPIKFLLQKGKQYYWCTCGWSHNQPFCDGKHKNPHYKISLKPIRIVPEETREYWLCNCKQTKRRPFCDGTHKTPEVQETPRVYKNNF
ncbi:CDGSH iron-sulfur domain-containing protein 3, mitochondrial-like [Varroa destructor]|uniref:Iron-binding zinc finger CDGSH type domain-containing protein n=1 Tax=Varroa destructor TaxID=109461 RepID=A0A7M7MFL8_VARDE|nr:CDGSH iron-sulfur domain-containing protein 3, mitochondrial-like [Varroa destructor]